MNETMDSYNIINAYLAQNDIIVTGCSDSVVRAYDVHSGQCLKYAETLIAVS